MPEDSPVSARRAWQGRGGGEYWFIPGKFRFCLNCGQTHEALRQGHQPPGQPVGRGPLVGHHHPHAQRHSPTVRRRKTFQPDQPDPRKLLGFTDNRQDAALQAGHFNDFVFLLTLRSALIGALQNHRGRADRRTPWPTPSSRRSALTGPTSAPWPNTCARPKLMGLARQEAQRTLRFIIGYRLLRDLRRGWRFNNPNLDQLNLLTIAYRGLDEFCARVLPVRSTTPVLASISPAQRAQLGRHACSTACGAACAWKPATSIRWSKTRPKPRPTSTSMSAGPSRRMRTSKHRKYLILTKRPEIQGQAPRQTSFQAARARACSKTSSPPTSGKTAPLPHRSPAGKTRSGSSWSSTLLQAASTLRLRAQARCGSSQLIGWRLNASCHGLAAGR
ncbi:MAG: hypothetical protein V9G23_16215 [Giesbergeria sp.]